MPRIVIDGPEPVFLCDTGDEAPRLYFANTGEPCNPPNWHGGVP